MHSYSKIFFDCFQKKKKNLNNIFEHNKFEKNNFIWIYDKDKNEIKWISLKYIIFALINKNYDTLIDPKKYICGIGINMNINQNKFLNCFYVLNKKLCKNTFCSSLNKKKLTIKNNSKKNILISLSSNRKIKKKTKINYKKQFFSFYKENTKPKSIKNKRIKSSALNLFQNKKLLNILSKTRPKSLKINKNYLKNKKIIFKNLYKKRITTKEDLCESFYGNKHIKTKILITLEPSKTQSLSSQNYLKSNFFFKSKQLK